MTREERPALRQERRYRVAADSEEEAVMKARVLAGLDGMLALDVVRVIR